MKQPSWKALPGHVAPGSPLSECESLSEASAREGKVEIKFRLTPTYTLQLPLTALQKFYGPVISSFYLADSEMIISTHPWSM